MIHYVTGDATSFSAGDPKNPKMLVHVTNQKGGWGAGIVTAISKRWTQPEAIYRHFKQVLGTFQIAEVGQGRYVCNVCAQDGYSKPGYAACNLEYLATAFALLKHTISLAPTLELHMPRVGCGLGGRSWGEIEPIIDKYFTDPQREVFVYDLP